MVYLSGGHKRQSAEEASATFEVGIVPPNQRMCTKAYIDRCSILILITLEIL